MAQTDPQAIPVDDFVRAIGLNVGDELVLSQFIEDNAIEVPDLLALEKKADLPEAGIELSDNGMDSLWHAIQSMNHQCDASATSTATDTAPGVAPTSPTSRTTRVPVSVPVPAPEPVLVAASKASKQPKTPTASNNSRPALPIHYVGGMVGLNNLGNTCFLNSAIQCVLHPTGLSNELIGEVNDLDCANKTFYADGNDLESNGSDSQEVDKDTWWLNLEDGDELDAYDTRGGNWYAAKVVRLWQLKPNKRDEDVWKVKVHYIGWPAKYDQTLTSSQHLHLMDPPGTHWRCMLKTGDKVDYFDRAQRKWRIAKITYNSTNKMFKVQYGKKAWECDDIPRKSIDTNQNVQKMGCKTNKNAQKQEKQEKRGVKHQKDRRGSQDPSWISSATNYMFGSGNYWSNRSYSGNTGYYERRNFYEAWLQMLKKVHVDKIGYSFAPTEVRDLVAKYNPDLGDGGQHDAIETLKIILHGIESSLPEKFDYSEHFEIKGNMYDLPMQESIYDKNFNWSVKTDVNAVEKLAQTRQFGHKTNLVSKYFDGIQVTKETCLNCGFQRRLYNKFRELLLPVTETYIWIRVCYFSVSAKQYRSKCLKLPDNCDIKWLKFLLLCKIYNKANCQSMMNNFALVKLDRNCKQFDGIAEVLPDDTLLLQILKDIESDRACLVLVHHITVERDSRFDHYRSGPVCSKYQTLFLQVSGNDLLVCLLSLPQGEYSFKRLKMDLNANKKTSSFLRHIFSYKSLLASPSGSTRRTSRTNTSSSYGMSYDHDASECLLYCNGKLAERDTDIFMLAPDRVSGAAGTFASNVIVSFEDSLQSLSVGNFQHLGHRKNLTELECEIDSIITQIKNFSVSQARDFITSAIANFEQRLDLRRQSDNSVDWTKSVARRLDPSRQARQRINLSLKAHSRLLQMLSEFESGHETALQTLSKAIESFAQNDEGCNGRYFDAKSCNKLNECWGAYWKESFVMREDLVGSFECNCVESDQKSDDSDVCKYIETMRGIVVLPELLIISLERGQGGSKKDHVVTFPETIRFDIGGVFNVCSLQAVCNHHGGTNKFGHYTAHVKKLGTKEDWYLCDDSSCYKSKFSCRNAIMMIYSNMK